MQLESLFSDIPTPNDTDHNDQQPPQKKKLLYSFAVVLSSIAILNQSRGYQRRTGRRYLRLFQNEPRSRTGWVTLGCPEAASHDATVSVGLGVLCKRLQESYAALKSAVAGKQKLYVTNYPW